MRVDGKVYRYTDMRVDGSTRGIPGGTRAISGGNRGYPGYPWDTRGTRGIPGVPGGYPGYPGDTRGYPGDTRGIWGYPGNTRVYPGCPGDTRGYPGDTLGTRGIPEGTRGYRHMGVIEHTWGFNLIVFFVHWSTSCGGVLGSLKGHRAHLGVTWGSFWLIRGSLKGHLEPSGHRWGHLGGQLGTSGATLASRRGHEGGMCSRRAAGRPPGNRREVAFLIGKDYSYGQSHAFCLGNHALS